MRQDIISIRHENKEVTLHCNALFNYQGFQVIESFNEHMDECYYLLFYKEQFLTAKKTVKIKRFSTLQKVLSNGIQIPSPHPIITSLLAANHIDCFPTIPSTWKKIKRKFNNLEAHYILPLFDSYLKKENITSALKEAYFEYRRDGKLSYAFKLLMTILDSYPTHKWAKSIYSHLDYLKYKQLYSNDINKVLLHDPLYAEKLLYQQLDAESSFSLLIQKLGKESRNLELTALYQDRLITSSKNASHTFSELVKLLSHTFSENDQASILLTIYNQTNSTNCKEEILNQLLTSYMKANQFEEAFSLITSNTTPLSKSQIDMLLTILNQMETIYKIDFTQFDASILKDTSADQLGQILAILLPKLFTDHDLDFVYQWTTPFHHLKSSNAIIEKIKLMNKIKEEPDQQHYMGELYYQLHLLPQAIECFSWDLELNPTITRPIMWLTKLYHELGMVEESKSYQYLYNQVQKLS
ncbi:hypothetical protein [Fredinandcohnia quinoae]|uniref:Uncharacterized protein n=1 Tax=Fredinandcohnia quinoae TaxID=2918902 RepID=A0AAW5EBX0_9BACI|nr:hypothetical protein [Fredinandcohnia sp. SECRCQ15]MCH1627160.1 hypothetical protein [Fredinandcohnia sp. SECRCQ15]